MNLSDRRSLEIARAVARALESDPDGVLQKGLDNILSWQRGSGRHPHLEAWEAIIREGPEAVRTTLTALDDRSRQLRSSSPFAGAIREDVRFEALDRASRLAEIEF